MERNGVYHKVVTTFELSPVLQDGRWNADGLKWARIRNYLQNRNMITKNGRWLFNSVADVERFHEMEAELRGLL